MGTPTTTDTSLRWDISLEDIPSLSLFCSETEPRLWDWVLGFPFSETITNLCPPSHVEFLPPFLLVAPFFASVCCLSALPYSLAIVYIAAFAGVGYARFPAFFLNRFPLSLHRFSFPLCLWDSVCKTDKTWLPYTSSLL